MLLAWAKNNFLSLMCLKLSRHVLTNMENYFERVMKAKFLKKDKFVCLRPFGNMKEALLDLGPGVQEVLKIALKVTLF